jgi:hypothetical protein
MQIPRMSWMPCWTHTQQRLRPRLQGDKPHVVDVLLVADLIYCMDLQTTGRQQQATG